MKNSTKEALLFVGVPATLIVAFIVWRGLRTEWKTIWDWNEPINTFAGSLFTVRMPRGQYMAASPDLYLQAQNSIGTETLLVMVAPTVQPEEYTIRSVVIDVDSGDAYPIEVIVHPGNLQAIQSAGGQS